MNYKNDSIIKLILSSHQYIKNILFMETHWGCDNYSSYNVLHHELALDEKCICGYGKMQMHKVQFW